VGGWGGGLGWGNKTAQKIKVKVSRNMPGPAQGVPGRLRPRNFLTFGTTRVVGPSVLGTGCLYTRRNPWYSFLEAESTPGAHGSVGSYGKKIPSDTNGNRSRDRPTCSAVPYARPRNSTNLPKIFHVTGDRNSINVSFYLLFVVGFKLGLSACR